jgi:DNA-binding beta-propeller fold protein YncE
VLNPTAVVSGLNSSGGVAVDQAGNVYVANSGGNQVLKETLQANGSYVQGIVVDSTDTPLGTVYAPEQK